MKCPKCGEELKAGYLYCDKCGEEIRIVPDFEPEIENSIIETLSAVAENVLPKQKKKANAEKEDAAGKDDVFMVESKQRFGKRVVFAVFAFSVFAVLLYHFGISKMVFGKEDYLQTQLVNASNAYENKDYQKAAQYYENALKQQKEAKLLIAYADCLYELGKYNQALSNYYAAIDLEPENEMAYARIIAMYEAEEDYEAITQLIASGSEEIQEAFQNYRADLPNFNYESGVYDTVLPLKITASAAGDIYYTLDGSDPMTNGILYTAPVFLRNGEYRIKAVYINDYGICSEIAAAEYTIEVSLPQAPMIEPQSGQYELPQMITVTVPSDCIVYYTTDGSMPDKTSSIYGEPIPMKEGVSNYRFVALDEEGNYSETVARSYQLTVETTLTAEESVYRLKHRLLEKEMILDMEGSLIDRKGKNIYVYNSLQLIEDKIMHVIYEYYQEGNSSRNMTGKIYCIDVSNGYVYRIAKDENGNDILDPI